MIIYKLRIFHCQLISNILRCGTMLFICKEKLMEADFRIHQDNMYIDQYLNYGRHEGNKFSYDDSKKTLSVSYYSKLPHPECL